MTHKLQLYPGVQLIPGIVHLNLHKYRLNKYYKIIPLFSYHFHTNCLGYLTIGLTKII